MSNAVFFAKDQVPIQEEVLDKSDGIEDKLPGLSVLAADAGKGVAEELLIDLDMKPAELERFRFQSRTKNWIM